MTTGIELITAERLTQVAVKGWTPENDDRNISGELLECAILIAGDVRADDKTEITDTWPVERASHVAKKHGDNIIHRLTIAGALIAAEIDRRLRAKNAESTPSKLKSEKG